MHFNFLIQRCELLVNCEYAGVLDMSLVSIRERAKEKEKEKERESERERVERERDPYGL